jgi:Ser/Thr protein kinase RdoA (MazF antagonist)
MDQHALDELAGEFGLRVLSSHHIKGGAKNTSYLIAATDGHFVATVLEQQGPAFAEAYGSFLQQTIEHGFPTAPPRRTLQGKWFHLHNQKPVLMTSFIPGFYDRPLNEAEIFQLGILLARIHDSDLKRDVPPTVRLDETDLCWLEESSSAPFASWALVRHQQTADAVQADGLHRPTHGDPFRDNIVVTGDKNLVLLDWEEAALDLPEIDLAMASLSHCRAEALDLTRVECLIAGYASCATMPVSVAAVLRTAAYAGLVIAYRRYRRYLEKSAPPSLYLSMQGVVDLLMSELTLDY